jgi:hypothetical protein
MADDKDERFDRLIDALAELLRTKHSHVAYSAGVSTGLEYFQTVRTTTAALADRDPYGTQFFWQGILHAWVLEYATAVGNDAAPGKVFSHLMKQAEEQGGITNLVDMVRRLAILDKMSEPSP